MLTTGNRAQRLSLALHSGMTPGSAQGASVDSGIQQGWLHKKHEPHLLYLVVLRDHTWVCAQEMVCGTGF